MSEIPHTNITRLVVNNYRSLVDVDVTLKPLTVFVGQNGSGKSNVIDVLRFVRDALTEGFDCALAKRGGFCELRSWFADDSEEVSIQLHFEGPKLKGEYGFAFGEHGLEVEIISERLSIKEADEALFFEVANGQLVSVADSLRNQPLPPSKRVLTLSQFNEPRVKAVRDFLANMNFYDLSPDILRKPQRVKKPFPLLETGENLASALREMQKRDDDDLITDALEAVVEGIDGYLVEQVNGHLITKLHYTYPAVPGTFQTSPEGRASVRVRQFNSHLTYEADGTIRMLGILTALYQERYPSPLVIEEPAKEIYSRELGVCSDVLKDSSLNNQVIATTHSPDLMTELPADTLRVVEKEDGYTKIGPMSDHQHQAIAEKIFSAGTLMRIEGLEREVEV